MGRDVDDEDSDDDGDDGDDENNYKYYVFIRNHYFWPYLHKYALDVRVCLSMKGGR